MITNHSGKCGIPSVPLSIMDLHKYSSHHTPCETSYDKSLFSKNLTDRNADIEKTTRLTITPDTIIVVVETVSKKSNLTAISGLYRKANKTGDAIMIMTKTNFVFSYPSLYKAGK